MRYSLINVYKEHDGLVDGTWIQDCTGTLEEATKAARDTERANSNRISVAVVGAINSCAPDYSPKTDLKRLDCAKDSPMQMEFDLFQSVCRYQGLAYTGNEGARLEFEPTCRHPDKFPNGCGRGPCDEMHCPYYRKRLILEGDRV